MEKYTAKILKIKDEDKDVKTYYLEIPEGIDWEAGAHMHVAIKGFFNGEKINNELVRHLSIASLKNEKVLVFTTRFNKIVTIFKMKLSKLKVGDELEIYTINNRIKLNRENKKIIFLSQGVAFATIRPLIKEYVENTNGIKEVKSLNINKNDLFLYKEELDNLQSDNYKNYWFTKRDDFYDKVKNVIGDDSLYYVVGSDPFIKTVIKFLKENGVSTEDIRLDKKEEGLELFLKAN